MAQNQQTVKCEPDVWTQITNADVTSITFMPINGAMMVRFTTDTTTPTESWGIVYQPGYGELQKAISSLTNLSGADRVWCKPFIGRASLVYVDHA